MDMDMDIDIATTTNRRCYHWHSTVITTAATTSATAVHDRHFFTIIVTIITVARVTVTRSSPSPLP